MGDQIGVANVIVNQDKSIAVELLYRPTTQEEFMYFAVPPTTWEEKAKNWNYNILSADNLFSQEDDI